MCPWPGLLGFSRVLVSVQLAISVGLITCTLIMYHQLEHLMARDLGIDQERIIAVDTEALDDLKPYHPRLVEAFLRHSRIASVTTLKDNFLSKPYMFELDYRAGTESGRETKVRPYVVDHNFVQTMNLELVRGRDFSLEQGDKKNLALISESAACTPRTRRSDWRDDQIRVYVAFGNGVGGGREMKIASSA